MENVVQAFTTGIWNVKKGKEEEFIKTWTKFASWSAEQNHASARLLQDASNPQIFVSVGKWETPEAIKKWRETPEFKDAMMQLSQLLAEPAQPHTMNEVAHVGEFEIV